MMMYGRNQHSIVKQFSSNKKKKKPIEYTTTFHRICPKMTVLGCGDDISELRFAFVNAEFLNGRAGFLL